MTWDTPHLTEEHRRRFDRARARRRVAIDLDGGEMHVCLAPDASPETIAALKAIGQAAVDRMRDADEGAS